MATDERAVATDEGSGPGGRSLALRMVRGLDGAFNRLYGWRYNPLYRSGSLVVVLLVVTLVTGLYLLLFYRIGAPYESVARITEQWWGGRWIRSLHRYASDALLVAVAVHALRMYAQGRSWGARTLAWVSGVVLVGSCFVVGWTGYVMVWDVQAQVLAAEGARLLDVIPLFSEPLARAFVGERPMPAAFFFLNLFLHILLPVGLALVLWIHVSRTARPALAPPKAVTWGVLGLLLAVSVLWPVGMSPAADLLRLPGRAEYDVFYAFWIPLTQNRPAGLAVAAIAAFGLALLLAPWWTRPRRRSRPAPSVVNERLCTGCEQCALDCPYEAISMVARTDGRAGVVARVNPALCVSCGICAGSCAPMGVGPPLRTGRDQLERVRAAAASLAPGPGSVVVLACERAGGMAGAMAGTHVLPVACAGSVHTSVIEILLRSGAGGVAVVACPPLDCWNREGAAWAEARMYRDREAELKARVDRRRVRLLYAAPGESARLAAELAAFRDEVRAVDAVDPGAPDSPDLVALCKAAESAAGVAQ